MTTHTTGLMWLLLVACVIAMLKNREDWRETIFSDRLAYAAAICLVMLGVIATLAWILWARTNALNPVTEDLGSLRLPVVLSSQLWWTLQTIAAFPMRGEAAPAVVYVIWFAAFIGVWGSGLRGSNGRTRLATLVLLVMCLAVPITLTVLTFPSEGIAWQGRYALPLAVGFTALAGMALNHSRERRATLIALVAACGIAHTVSVCKVAVNEAERGLAVSLVGAGAALPVVGTLAAIGVLIQWWGWLHAYSRPLPRPSGKHPEWAGSVT
jgi:hypothetical protein